MYGLMGIGMRASGAMASLADKAYIHEQMVENMMASGKMGNNMVVVNSYG